MLDSVIIRPFSYHDDNLCLSSTELYTEAEWIFFFLALNSHIERKTGIQMMPQTPD